MYTSSNENGYQWTGPGALPLPNGVPVFASSAPSAVHLFIILLASCSTSTIYNYSTRRSSIQVPYQYTRKTQHMDIGDQGAGTYVPYL